MWIWQQPEWPDFHWDSRLLAPLLRQTHFNQGLLLGRMGLEDQQQATLDTLLANIIHSSAIEGEKLNAFSVRSSQANKLGINGCFRLVSAEQVRVLNRLLDGEFELGISSSQYQKVAKVSRATATRHLAQLVERGCLSKTDAGGRSTRYVICSIS